MTQDDYSMSDPVILVRDSGSVHVPRKYMISIYRGNIFKVLLINLIHDPLFCRRATSLYSASLCRVAACVVITRDTHLCCSCAELSTEYCERGRVSLKQLHCTAPRPYFIFLRRKSREREREKRINLFFCDCERSM